MIKQTDTDGNVVLVIPPREMGSVVALMAGAGVALKYSIARVTEDDAEVGNQLLAAAMQLTDEQLIDGLMAGHATHEHDDHVELLDEYTDLVTWSRKFLVEAGRVDPA